MASRSADAVGTEFRATPERLPQPGAPIEDVVTPALVVDLPTFEANIARLHDYFTRASAKARPHAKIHRSVAIAQIQLAAGGTVGGVCVGSVSQAAAMVHGGIRDCLITRQVVSRQATEWLMELQRDANVMVCVDDEENIANLAACAKAAGVTLGCMVEIDVGLDRCGVQPGAPAVALAQQIVHAKGLAFAGLQGYEGGLTSYPDREARRAIAQRRTQLLLETVDAVRSHNIPVETVSAGGTATWDITGGTPGITEVQAGAYIFMDLHFRYCSDFDLSLAVLGTVISRPRHGLAVLDCGMKATGPPMGQLYQHMKGFSGFPEVIGVEGARMTRLNAEHGVLDLESAEAEALRVGDMVRLAPAYAEVVCSQHDHFIGVRDGVVEGVWPIVGRGANG